VNLISEQTIRECQKGKRQAQRAIYDSLAGRMYGVCLRYTRNQAEAEDCLQDGFVKVFSRIGDFRFEGSFEGWVRRIIVNTVIEHFRRRTLTTEYVDIEEITEVVRHEETDIGELNAAWLLQLIKELPPQYQVVFSLFAIEGYPHDEIAKMLNISEGTSKSNLSRARKWLQKRIEETKHNDEKRYVHTT
jgi:RNA polymerase sigma-70 factor (ECF subfamily)